MVLLYLWMYKDWYEILQSIAVSEFTPGAGGVEKESGLTVGTWNGNKNNS